jgi:transposase
MKKKDAHILYHKCLSDLRRRAISAVESGESPEFVARVFGVSLSVICGWLSLYRRGSWNDLNAIERHHRLGKLDGPEPGESTKP